MMTLALVGGTLIDGNGGPPLQNQTVLIDGERITAAGPAAKTPVPAGARLVDATGKSVMPGLVDAHNHICGEVDSGGPPHRKLPVFGAIRGVAAARKLLDMGFTACRAMGSATPMQAIVANTRMGADVMGLLDQFGTVEPGKLADVIVVDGDPLKDIAILQHREKIRMVIKGGEVFRGDL
jgi:imidazolonepropionase-like amidohydrolase